MISPALYPRMLPRHAVHAAIEVQYDRTFAGLCVFTRGHPPRLEKVMRQLISYVGQFTLLISLVAADVFCVAHERPNELFIAIDDLNDWVGVLGRASAGTHAEYGSVGTARHAVHQRPLSGAVVQSLTNECAHRAASIVNRGLRIESLVPRCSAAARAGDFTSVLCPAWLPMRNAAPVPGSRGRTVELRAHGVYWEGKPIAIAAPIPGY